MDKTMDKTLEKSLNAFTDNQFEETVLQSAQSQADSIIAQAEQKHEEIMEKTKADYPRANYQQISLTYQQENEQILSAKELELRNELLNLRTNIVDTMFEEIRAELVSFTKGANYASWLQNKMNSLIPLVENSKVVLSLRTEDLSFAEDLKNNFKECTVVADDTIAIGGFKLQSKNRLYDETLDEYFIEQQENFYATGELDE